MPRNRRPQSYIVSNPDYQNTTIEQRRQMQNTWDLLEQQEIANDLAQQKLKQDEINSKRQAEATIQAAREAADREYNNKLKLENQKFINELELELARQNHDRLMRYNELCDKYNLNYNDLKNIETYLNKSNADIDNEIETEENDISTLKQKLNKLENPYTKYNQERLSIKGQIDRLYYKINEYKTDTSIINKLFNNKKYKTKIKDYENEIDLMNKRLEELEIKLQNIDDTEYYSKKDSINQLIADKENNIKKLKEQNTEYIANAYKDFMEFRQNHYNEEIEDLFEKLDLHLFRIKDKDIKNTGTIKDYKTYIKRLKDR